MFFIAAAVLALLIGVAGTAVRRNRQANSDVLNARLEDACHTSLASRVEAACGHAR